MKALKYFSLIFIISLNLNALEKVSLQLDWLHQFQFAGYYMAKEKGYYKQKNLEVEIKEYKYNMNITKEVLSQKSNFGVGKSSLILDALEGKNILLLSVIYQNSPMVLVTLNKSNIKKIEDLKGKRISLTSSARLMASINSMLVSKGINQKDIKHIEHTFKIQDLIDGKTDAMACYLSNEPYILEKKGIDYTIHNPNDYGFNFYGGILFTSQEEKEKHPLRVKNFNEASLKGWKYAFENIEETAKLIFKKYNTQNKSLDSLIYEGKVLKNLSLYDKDLLGKIDKKRIEELKRLYFLLSLDIDLQSDIQNLIYEPFLVNLTKKEKEYLKNNTITLLSNSNFAPLVFKDRDKILTGIEIDYWKLINKKLQNTNHKIKEIQKNNSTIESIKQDKNSIKYASSIFDNNKILEKSETLFNIPVALVTLKDKAFIYDIDELENKKIAIDKYSICYPILKSKYPHLKLVETNSLKESISKLLNKEVFAVFGKLPRLSYLIRKNIYSGIKISGTFDEKYEAKLAINKENKILIDIINKAILSISLEEKKAINSKYYHVIYRKSFDYSLIYKILLPLLIFILIILTINVKLKKEIKKRKEIEEELKKIASLDNLTKSYNRRTIEQIFESEISREKRYKRDLSIIFFDIDNFKKINDSFGHKEGDEVLIKISNLVKKHIRKADSFGRWGGEEFIIILPETSKEEAKQVACFIRNKINQHDFNLKRRITCSFGVSQFKENDTASSIISRTDDAMYDVKRNGKDGVKVV